MAKKKESVKHKIKDLFRQPAEDFYCQPELHINCSGRIWVENCKGILEYSPEMVKLNMGKWDVTVWGDELELSGVGKKVAELRGKIFKTEIFYKEG